MLKYIDSKKMGRSKLGWLDSYFHFSFAEYFNPKNMQFGVLRVINDDLISPKTGFDTHPHRDMEIITYVVDGEVTHSDSMKNKHTLSRGQVQYMSAGTGVTHSEYNMGDQMLRLLQIWISPDKKGCTPNYGDFKFNIDDRKDCWLPIASSIKNKETKAPVYINADINMYATLLSTGSTICFKVLKNRQAYLVLIEGEALINNTKLFARDALEIAEEDITIQSILAAHILIVEMEKNHE